MLHRSPKTFHDFLFSQSDEGPVCVFSRALPLTLLLLWCCRNGDCFRGALETQACNKEKALAYETEGTDSYCLQKRELREPQGSERFPRTEAPECVQPGYRPPRAHSRAWCLLGKAAAPLQEVCGVHGGGFLKIWFCPRAPSLPGTSAACLPWAARALMGR